MKNLFWNIFEKSGNIDAFMLYKEYERKSDRVKTNAAEEKGIIQDMLSGNK